MVYKAVFKISYYILTETKWHEKQYDYTGK